MLRFLARAAGLLLVAAAFVGLVIDATRSLANSRASFTPLGDLASTLFPKSYPLLEPTVTHSLPSFVWDPVLTSLLLLPASVVALVVGMLLLWAGQKRPELIGYPAES